MQGYILIFGLLVISDFIAIELGLSIPGSIIGLITLFIIFCIKGNISDNLDRSTKALLKYLPLFLVPVGVGIKELLRNTDPNLITMLVASLMALFCAVFVSALVITQLTKIFK